MKKLVSTFLLAAFAVLFASCSQGAESRNGATIKTVSDVLNQQAETTEETTANSETIFSNQSGKRAADVDLTELSSTVVYSEVYCMMVTPNNFIGKTVRMNGVMAVSKGEHQNYYACIIKDATACCSQGIEFVLDAGIYPQEGEYITVYGTFDTYQEGTYQYCQLKNAVLE